MRRSRSADDRMLGSVSAATAASASTTPPVSTEVRPRPTPRPRPTLYPRTAGRTLPPREKTAPAGVPAPDATPPDAAADALAGEEIAEDLAALGEAVPPATLDVWALVRHAQDGDAEAFGRLYEHYVTVVYRYLLHRVGDRAQAEDFTSETFVRALRRIDSLSFQGRDVGAWLVTIARNIVRDHVKSSRFRLEVTIADMRDADPGTDGPEDAVVQALINQQLLSCIRQLGSDQQECISLRFLQGLSVAETAAVMGKKDGAIKALQHRAVRRLAGLLPEGLW